MGIAAALLGEAVPEHVRARALRRLRYLWTFEAAGAVYVPGLAIALVVGSAGRVGLPTLAGAALCSGLLVVGAWYWLLKARQLKAAQTGMPPSSGVWQCSST